MRPFPWFSRTWFSRARPWLLEIEKYPVTGVVDWLFVVANQRRTRSPYPPLPEAQSGPDGAREKTVRHESMKRNEIHAQNEKGVLKAPAFQYPGNKILEKIAASVGNSRGYLLKNIDVAQIIGKSESTTSFWLGAFEHPHIVALFSLLEHLPVNDRHRAIDSLCRELPLLDHPRLHHDLSTVRNLQDLLRQPQGLTFLVGGSEPQRALVFSALGHSFYRIDQSHRMPIGLDVNEPSSFVPIETMLYLRGGIQGLNARHVLPRIVRSICGTNHPLLLLNGVWSAVPELRSEISKEARRRHVIVSEQQLTGDLTADRIGGNAATLISVSTCRTNPAWISLKVGAT